MFLKSAFKSRQLASCAVEPALQRVDSQADDHSIREPSGYVSVQVTLEREVARRVAYDKRSNSEWLADRKSLAEGL